MDLKYRNIFLLLFMLAFIATIVVYFSSDKDMQLTWYIGGAAILFYLIYRFSKK
jgi:phosphate starvation-inducible membrane PsiE